MYCDQCGRPLSPRAKYCPHCGAPRSGEHSPLAAPRPARKKKKRPLKPILLCIAVLAAVVLLLELFSSGRRTECPDPVTFFSLSEIEDNVLHANGSGYLFGTGFSNTMSDETAWQAMTQYQLMLERECGAEVTLEKREQPYDHYRFTADFGRVSLFNNSRRDLIIVFHGGYWYFDYGWDYGYLRYIPTEAYAFTPAARTEPSVEMQTPVQTQPPTEAEPPEQTQPPAQTQPPEETQAPAQTQPPKETEPETTARGSYDSPVVPDFCAFCNDCAFENSVTEYIDHTKYIYFWNYNAKAQAEYIALLEDYGFALRDSVLSENSDLYSFDYTGPGTMGTFDSDFGMKMKDASRQDIALYLWSCHYGSTGGEIHIWIADGAQPADTGERTTRKLTPREDSSGSSGSISFSDSENSDKGVLDCLTCRGSGDCTRCGGSGYVSFGGARASCSSCHQSGDCSSCGGSGKR